NKRCSVFIKLAVWNAILPASRYEHPRAMHACANLPGSRCRLWARMDCATLSPFGMVERRSEAQMELGMLPNFTQAFSLAAAVVCGALIGFERQLRGHPAGLHTNALVAL